MKINPFVINASLKQYVRNNQIYLYRESEKISLEDFKIMDSRAFSGLEAVIEMNNNCITVKN